MEHRGVHQHIAQQGPRAIEQHRGICRQHHPSLQARDSRPVAAEDAEQAEEQPEGYGERQHPCHNPAAATHLSYFLYYTHRALEILSIVSFAVQCPLVSPI